jgi:hypothetical protein
LQSQGFGGLLIRYPIEKQGLEEVNFMNISKRSLTKVVQLKQGNNHNITNLTRLVKKKNNDNLK